MLTKRSPDVLLADNQCMDKQPLYGTVNLRSWNRLPNGVNIIALRGTLIPVAAEDVLGFKTNSRDSNWGIRVKGSTNEFYVMGCEVLSVHLHPESESRPPNGGDVYAVP